MPCGWRIVLYAYWQDDRDPRPACSSSSGRSFQGDLLTAAGWSTAGTSWDMEEKAACTQQIQCRRGLDATRRDACYGGAL